MKRFLVISSVVLAACGSGTQPAATDNNKLPTSIVNNPHSASGIDTSAAAMKPVLVFEDTSYSFGTMKEGEVAVHEFHFANKGKTPLIITSAQGSCGCTVTEYPGEPIAPGEAATMKVTFNTAGKQGHQEKSVTLQTNTLRSIHMLYIQAEVEKK